MAAIRSCDQPLTADRPNYGPPFPNPITPSFTQHIEQWLLTDLLNQTNVSENSWAGSRVCLIFKPLSNNQPHTEWPMCFSLKRNRSALREV